MMTDRAVALDRWELARVDPERASRPEELAELSVEWLPATVPGTAAGALADAGRWTLDDDVDFDAHDWWYRCRFETETTPGEERILRFGGLATIADVWLNGTLILHSSNMFLAHECEVSALLRDRNELLIRCRALRTVLAIRRPRGRWRTRLVESQQLRWIRTTLLGRMPGWSPPAAPVGPWRPVTLAGASPITLGRTDLSARVNGTTGIVALSLAVRSSAPIERAELLVGALRAPLELARTGQDVSLEGTLSVPDAALWWPHTHGAQPRYPVRVVLHGAAGPMTRECGSVGFRTVELDSADGAFAIRVNGVPVFCRGACWTPLDVVRFTPSAEDYRAALELARDAGMNMIRLGGTMVYEDDAFYELCDELGILVWQDFMFANMDYPALDDAFATSIREEATQLLRRLQGRPCLAVLCGGSEVEQQAAMLGLPPTSWSGPLFQETLPALSAEHAPGVPWWPSSPSGGTVPFQSNAGAAHYYGVGAYLRPLEDARRADVRFASECLAFSNVPEPRTLDELLSWGQAPTHHPRWKRRVPRDAGASWDFEDVRDHYLALLFRVDPRQARHTDMERYLALSRVVTGEVMAATFAEWRRARSTCRGALVFLFNDLWPGAGWGVVDSEGRPKAAYWYLKRALQPVALLATDEGVNGLALHLVNDGAAPIDAELRLELFRSGETPVGAGGRAVIVPARSAVEIHADALLEGFRDLTYAYRFGPPGHDLVVATLLDRASGARLGQAFTFPVGLPAAVEGEIGLTAELSRDERGWTMMVRSRRFAQSVWVDIPGWVPDDNYFHVAPGGSRMIRLQGDASAVTPGGSVTALNSAVRATAAIASRVP